MMLDIKGNLKQLLADAPSTRCGACGAEMEAIKVTLGISTRFDWQDFDPKKFMPPFDLSPRYDGDVEYRCPNCQTSLIYRQRVIRQGYHFSFIPPQEENS